MRSRRRLSFVRLIAAAGAGIVLAACGSSEQATPPQAADAAEGTDAAASEAAPSAPPLAGTDQTWTPEAMEALLAPVALYPDPVLSQVLLASTNPQEVLDAGNWLVANPEIEGKALDQAVEKAGFTPPMRAIMQFRQIVDQLCLEMGWTTELGQAFTNDEAGVFAAVQRLREQAQDVGNLQSSEQMKVEEKTQDGQQAIVISPPSPEVVYVPQYDPVAAYAPAPTATTAQSAPTTTQPAPMTTPTTVEEDKGHSTGSMIATGVLAFGAGMLVNEIFDDDDDDYWGHSYYYPNYWGGYMRPPPPYYYRPMYGNGYRPNHYYNRSPTYNKVMSDNNIVVVNRNDNYWGGFDDRPKGKARSSSVKSPITAAKPNRPELAQLNAQAKAPREHAGQAARSTGANPDWKGQSGYAGAKPEVRAKAKLPPPSKTAASKATANAASARAKVSTPSVDRSSGAAATVADRGRASTPKPAAAKPAAAAKVTSAAQSAGASRPAGVSKPASMPSRPKPAAESASRQRNTAMSGSNRGAADGAASQRGRASLPQGARSKGGGRPKRR